MKKFMIALMVLITGVMSFADDLHMNHLEPEWDLVVETESQLVYHNIKNNSRIIRSYVCPISNELVRYTSESGTIKLKIVFDDEFDWYVQSYRMSDESYITVLSPSESTLNYIVDNSIGR